MSSQVSDLGLKEAIVHSVDNGAYPESEDVSSAELPSSVLPALLVDIQKARDEVKVWVTLCHLHIPHSDSMCIGRHSPVEQRSRTRR